MLTTLTRRRFIGTWAGVMVAIGTACQSQEIPVAPAASAKPAAASTPPPAPGAPTPAAVAPTAAAAGAPTQAARAETLIMSVSDTFNQFPDAALVNPFLRAQYRTGWHFMFEPLFFYNPYWTKDVAWPKGLPGREAEIPWLAESYEYNEDNTELALKLRPGVTWSDGQPFSSQDLSFTLNMLKDNSPDLLWSFDMKTWVKEVQTPDPLTAKIVLTRPNPQFMARYFEWFTDIGFPIVPEHIFKGQDQKTFANLDIDKGWPVVTGPWKLTFSSADQKVYERRDDWWGGKTGFRQLPRVKRIVMLPRFDDAKKIQLLIGNEVDTTHTLIQSAVPALLERSKAIVLWTEGNKPPYGIPNGSDNYIGFNCSKPPFDDPEIRRAINFAIDRKQIDDVVYHGSIEFAELPFAPLPSLKRYADACADLLKKYPTAAPDPAKTAQILEAKGWQKDSEGLWAKDGQRFPMVMTIPTGFFQDIVPVIVAQLRKAGFDASFKAPTNYSDLQLQGDVDAFMAFDSAVYSDPWVSLDQYHSRYTAPTGQTAVQPFRWQNAAFDKIVEEMGVTRSTDPKFMELFLQAVEIWLQNLPILPMLRAYNYIPYNTTYWHGWPNEKNPYVGGSSWHRGATTILVHALEPA